MLTNLTGKRPAGSPLGRIWPALVGLLVVLLVAGCSNGQDLAVELTPPAGFERITEIDLSARPYEGETLGQFTVAEDGFVGVFYTVQNVDTPLFDLSLVGPDGESYVVLHSEDYQTDAYGGGLWEQDLAAGDYQVVLTADQSPGTLSVYWGYSQ